MLRVLSLVTFASLSMPLLTGCENDEACTKARLDGADAWKAVYEQSSKLRLNGGLAFDELTQDKQAEHSRALEAVATQSEMVFKSFAYEKITWNTAGPARDKANQAFEGFFNKDKYPGLAEQLKAANARYEAVKAACGD
jgi:hypothetical protein